MSVAGAKCVIGRASTGSRAAAIPSAHVLLTAGALGAAFLSASAQAQSVTPPNGSPPTPASSASAHLAGDSSLLNLGSNFLERFGKFAGAGSDSLPGSNPQGGGGPDPEMLQRYRAWAEAYGLSARTARRNGYLGDERTTRGGVAGIGMTVAPGFQVSLSADRSRTRIGILDFPAGADVDVTQIGGGAFWEKGPWSLALAGVHGFGSIGAHRRDGIGAPSVASYDLRLWGALVELGYNWTFGQSRLIPKAGFDWTQSDTDAFTETGGSAPISGSAQTSRRTRAFAGAEFGHTWIFDRTLFDLAITGKAIDNLSQSGGAVQVTSTIGATTPLTAQAVREGRYGFDAGVAASWILSASTRLYALYDGRFHDGFTQHGGTIGVEVKW